MIFFMRKYIEIRKKLKKIQKLKKKSEHAHLNILEISQYQIRQNVKLQKQHVQINTAS